MLNLVTMLGRMAQDPVLRYTPSGTPVTNFDLAVPVRSKDRNAPPDFIPVVCWQDLAEFAGRYLSKGRQIVVEGRITTNKYTASDGKTYKKVEVRAHQIYFADSKSSGRENTGDAQDTAPAEEPAEAPAEAPSDYTAVEVDELPF